MIKCRPHHGVVLCLYIPYYDFPAAGVQLQQMVNTLWVDRKPSGGSAQLLHFHTAN